jgi:hypothetical protein
MNMARPTKPKDEARAKMLQVRVQQGEYLTFKEAAEKSGLDVSAWVRERLIQAARKESRGYSKPN